MGEDNQESRGPEPDPHPARDAGPAADPDRDRDADPSGETPAASPAGPPEHGFSPGPLDAWPPEAELPLERDLRHGLLTWFVILLVVGLVGLVFRMEEMSALTAIAGLFVASHAADLSPRWDALYYLTSWVVPAGGAVLAVVVGLQVLHSDLPQGLRLAMVAVAMAAAAASVLFVFRPYSDRLVAMMMRMHAPSHTLRLAARMTAVGLLLALPTWFALRSVFGETLEDTGPLLEHSSLGGQLVGYLILAFASVGLWLRRDFRETLDRLGLKPIAKSHIAIVAIGVMGFYGLNAAADWIQQAFFHDLWESDHRINQAIAAGMGPGRVLLFGLSAGVGEEITMRGALQPKLGLVMTSLLFASLHVQYSWFGMIVVFLLGLLLGTIRLRTSTTAAIAVHMVYDMIAVFSIQPAEST